MDLFDLQLVLLVVLATLLLFGLEEVDLLLLVLNLFVRLAVQGAGLKGALYLHVVGFHH